MGKTKNKKVNSLTTLPPTPQIHNFEQCKFKISVYKALNVLFGNILLDLDLTGTYHIPSPLLLGKCWLVFKSEGQNNKGLSRSKIKVL